jgi:hypothetical protein
MGGRNFKLRSFPKVWCGVTKAAFLNHQNERVMQGWNQFFQSLGDLKTTAKDFLDMFGVPDGTTLNRWIAMRCLVYGAGIT